MKQHPVWNVLSHATVIGSCMFILFFFIDRVNPAMDFLGSALSKWCLFVYCLASLITALCSAVFLFRREKAAQKHAHARRQTDSYDGRGAAMERYEREPARDFDRFAAYAASTDQTIRPRSRER